MKRWIIHRLIIFCSQKVLEHEQRKEVLIKNDQYFDNIYAVGLNVINRDIWLKRLKKLQKYNQKYDIEN